MNDPNCYCLTHKGYFIFPDCVPKTKCPLKWDAVYSKHDKYFCEHDTIDLIKEFLHLKHKGMNI